MNNLVIKERTSLLSNKLLEDENYDWLDQELHILKSEMLTFVLPVEKGQQEESQNLINLHSENKIRIDELEVESKSPPSSEGSFFSDIMTTLNHKFENDDNGEKSDDGCEKGYQNGGVVRANLQLELQPLLNEGDDGAESLDNFPLTDTPASVATLSASTDEKKAGKLKRVSFGSSKGSMVETLFYDAFNDDDKPLISTSSRNRPHLRCPVAKQPYAISDDGRSSRADKFLKVRADTGVVLRPASRVRVTFYESERPLTVSSPEPSEGTEPPDLDLETLQPSPHLLRTAMGTMLTPEHGSVAYDRQISSESGQDNPFRPDGDLSREADEFVELIKEGRPVAEAIKVRSGSQAESHPDEVDSLITPEKDITLLATPPASPVKNGTTKSAPSPPESPKSVGPVEVQRGVVVPPSGEGQVERVVIKKKNKKCCVVM